MMKVISVYEQTWWRLF